MAFDFLGALTNALTAAGQGFQRFQTQILPTLQQQAYLQEEREFQRAERARLQAERERTRGLEEAQRALAFFTAIHPLGEKATPQDLYATFGEAYRSALNKLGPQGFEIGTRPQVSEVPIPVQRPEEGSLNQVLTPLAMTLTEGPPTGKVELALPKAPKERRITLREVYGRYGNIDPNDPNADTEIDAADLHDPKKMALWDARAKALGWIQEGLTPFQRESIIKQRRETYHAHLRSRLDDYVRLGPDRFKKEGGDIGQLARLMIQQGLNPHTELRKAQERYDALKAEERREQRAEKALALQEQNIQSMIASRQAASARAAARDTGKDLGPLTAAQKRVVSQYNTLDTQLGVTLGRIASSLNPQDPAVGALRERAADLDRRLKVILQENPWIAPFVGVEPPAGTRGGAGAPPGGGRKTLTSAQIQAMVKASGKPLSVVLAEARKRGYIIIPNP